MQIVCVYISFITVSFSFASCSHRVFYGNPSVDSGGWQSSHTVVGIGFGCIIHSICLHQDDRYLKQFFIFR